MAQDVSKTVFQHQIHWAFIPLEVLYAVKTVDMTTINNRVIRDANITMGVTAMGGMIACSPPMVGCLIQRKNASKQPPMPDMNTASKGSMKKIVNIWVRVNPIVLNILTRHLEGDAGRAQRGISIVIVVPSPGAERTPMLPPVPATRSRSRTPPAPCR